MSTVVIYAMSPDDESFIDIDSLTEKFEEVHAYYNNPLDDDPFIEVDDIISEVAEFYNIFYTDLGNNVFIFHPTYLSSDDVLEALINGQMVVDDEE